MKLVIIDRAKMATFERMRGLFANNPEVMVLWDRRGTVERRHQPLLPHVPDQRVQERRRLTKSFGGRGFIVIDIADEMIARH